MISTFDPTACSDDLRRTRPAHGVWRRLSGTLSNYAREWADQRRMRRAEISLRDLDDRLLRDIGIERRDIARMVRDPGPLPRRAL